MVNEIRDKDTVINMTAQWIEPRVIAELMYNKAVEELKYETDKLPTLDEVKALWLRALENNSQWL